MTTEEAGVIVLAREKILDDILALTGGALPDYVWAWTIGRLGSKSHIRDT